jgi:2-(1,2-epoxy-1,2-dihydrophenyl)acetyl-CoA isomerase
MAGSELLFEVSDQIATITFNIPDKLNPLPAQLQHALRERLAQVRADASIRALMLTGAGRAFSVGADLGSMNADGAGGESIGNATANLMASVSNPMIEDLRTLPVPVISVVNGPAAGAGVGLALAADIVLAARSAYFYLPFMPQLGVVPDLGATWFLPRAVGRARALGLALLGNRLSAERAQQWGLIWACVDDADLPDEARTIALRLAALPAHAAPELRRAFDASEHNDMMAQLAYEAERQRELIDGTAFAEGVRAFIEKRPPRFNGH